MTEERLALWWAGKIEDEHLSLLEMQWLEEAVYTALQRKYHSAAIPSLIQ